MENVMVSLLKFRKPKQLELEDYLKKLLDKGLSKEGLLIPDPVPIAPPIGYKKQPSMVEIVRDMVRGERLAQAAREAGHETFEESEDFDVGDDPELMRSPWENEFDPPLDEILKAGREVLSRKEADEKASGAAPAPKPGPATEAGKASGERSATPPSNLPENE